MEWNKLHTLETEHPIDRSRLLRYFYVGFSVSVTKGGHHNMYFNMMNRVITSYIGQSTAG